jgi:hypothetical protein
MIGVGVIFILSLVNPSPRYSDLDPEAECLSRQPRAWNKTYCMNRAKELFGYFLTAIAAATAVLAVYEVLKGNLQASVVLAGLFVASTLLTYLPQMENFKAFGVEAKLQIQEKLDRAEEILRRVRELSIASAKVSYFDIASGGRWNGQNFCEKQKVFDLIDEQLRSIGVGEEERQEIARPHINFIGYDLYLSFYKQTKSAIQRHPQPDGSIVQEWDRKYMPKGLAAIGFVFKDGVRLTAYLKELVTPSLVSHDDYEKLTEVAETIGDVFDGCIKRRGYTDDCLPLLDRRQL